MSDVSNDISSDDFDQIDEGLALSVRIDELYQARLPLWTKDLLRDAESQLDVHPDYLDVQPFNGGPRLRISYCPTEGQGRETPGIARNSVVDFIDHESLLSRARYKRLNLNDLYVTYKLNRIALASKNHARRPNTHCAIRDFQYIIDRWEASQKCVELKEVFRRLPIPKGINKILCIGLGDLIQYRVAEDTICPKRLWGIEALSEFSPMAQHAAAMTIRDVLAERFGTPDIELLAQDPVYSEATQRVLTRMGFRIVGRHGAGGFAEIDHNTLVFNYRSIVNVREIIADIARPAVVITEWSDKGPGSVIDYAKDAIACYLPNGRPVMRAKKHDPDTPRTVVWQKDYKKFEWPECFTTDDPSFVWRGMILVRDDSYVDDE
ncbi:hypothetical protein F4779DRAFT_633875 [Xylariaceae sp. FL0662B]|nr:hypothetical protein F4779DRAFT_633875 [Xylariaceae sp. FL0662B]